MGRIPQITQTRSPLSTIGRTSLVKRVDVSTGVSAVADALQRGLEGVGDVLSKRASQIEESNLLTQLADFENKKSIGLQEAAKKAIDVNVESGILENVDGDDWDEEFVAEFNEDLDKIGTNIFTPRAREMFTQSKIRMDAKFQQNLALNRQAISAEKATLKANSIKNSRIMQAQNDPTSMPLDIWPQFKKDIDEVSRIYNLSELQKEKLLDESKFDFGVAAVRGRISQNAGTALVEIKGKKWDEWLTADQKSRLQTQAQNLVNSQNSKLGKTDLKKFTDPITFLEGRGETLPELSLDDITTTFTDRQTRIDELTTKFYGTDPKNTVIPFLSPLEAKSRVIQLKKLGAFDQVKHFSQVDRSLPGAISGKYFQALYPEDPELAIAGIMSEEAPGDAEHIILGGKLRSDKSKPLVLPQEKDFRNKFDEFIPPGFLTNSTAGIETRGAILQASINHYVSKQGNSLTGFVDEDAFNDSITAIMGEPLRRNNQIIPAYRSDREGAGHGKYVPADRTDEVIESLTDDLLEKHMGSKPFTLKGEPVNIENDISQLNFEPISEGLFFLRGSGPQDWLKDKDGNNYIIDLKKIEALIPEFSIREKQTLSRQRFRRNRGNFIKSSTPFGFNPGVK